MTLSTPRDALRKIDVDWVDAVTAALRDVPAAIGELAVCRWNSDAPAPAVALRTTATRPRAVLCLAAALPDGSGSVVSGVPVSWRWTPSRAAMAITIDALGGLAASTDYDVTLWVVGG